MHVRRCVCNPNEICQNVKINTRENLYVLNGEIRKTTTTTTTTWNHFKNSLFIIR